MRLTQLALGTITRSAGDRRPLASLQLLQAGGLLQEFPNVVALYFPGGPRDTITSTQRCVQDVAHASHRHVLLRVDVSSFVQHIVPNVDPLHKPEEERCSMLASLWIVNIGCLIELRITCKRGNR